MSRVLNIVKILVLSYVLTGILLLLLAFGMLKMNLSGGVVTAGIIAIYILASLGGGYILAHKEQTKRLMWGVAFGLIYFVVLFAISLIINKGVSQDYMSALRALFICMGAGAVGGFLS